LDPQQYTAILDLLTGINTTLTTISTTLTTNTDKEAFNVNVVSIPTEDAVVVTNNLLHPALDVVVIV